MARDPQPPKATDAKSEMMANLNAIVEKAFKIRRPILHHLNDDTSWLLQLPIPTNYRTSTSSSSANPPRYWYNIVLDPWLTGPQSDVASWFSKQWHVEPPALGSMKDVDELCAEVERISAGLEGDSRQLGVSRSQSQSTGAVATEKKEEIEVEEVLDRNMSPPSEQSTSIGAKTANKGTSPTPHIDAIVISHEFTDHCHKQTLLQASPSTTVIASTKAATLIRGWKHFHSRKVYETPPFKGDWIAARSGFDKQDLPEWIGVSRIVTPSDALYYHSAAMITFQPASTSTSTGTTAVPAESVIYTPHGIHADSLNTVTQAKPEIRDLALLHGLHDVSIDWGQQLNLGAHNGLAAQRALRARYWVGTHDEIKKGGGVVSWFLRRKVISVQEALEKVGEGELVKETGFLEARNGESLLLE